MDYDLHIVRQSAPIRRAKTPLAGNGEEEESEPYSDDKFLAVNHEMAQQEAYLRSLSPYPDLLNRHQSSAGQAIAWSIRITD